MECLFNGCNNLKEIKGINIFNTTKVLLMNEMFQGCANLKNLDLSNFNTSNVNFMDFMFNKCRQLKEIKGINNFNTNKVSSMKGMFKECNELKSLDLSNFNTINVTDMNNMFNGCFELEYLDLSNFNTSNITMMENMFNKRYKLKIIKGIYNFDIKKVINKKGMFEDCIEFEYNKEIISKFNLEQNQILEAINELLIEKENIIIYFISTDQNINTSISGFSTDLFTQVEEKLYLKHQELKNQNVVYLTNGM